MPRFSSSLLPAATVILPLLALQGHAQAQQANGGGRQEGQASYFNGGQNGHSRTASGQKVDPNSNTAASPNLPMGTTATVTNEKTGKSTQVRVNDRGPTRQGRVIDLSKKAAGDIGMTKSGTAPVVVQADPSKQPSPEAGRQLQSQGTRH